MNRIQAFILAFQIIVSPQIYNIQGTPYNQMVRKVPISFASQYLYENKKRQRADMQIYRLNKLGIEVPVIFSKKKLKSKNSSSLSSSFVSLHLSRYDNLVSGIAEISMGCSLGVLWSEYSILTTGCGPLNLSDGLERFCYQAVIAFAGLILFTRITTRNNSVMLCTDYFGYLEKWTVWQVQAAESLSILSVIGAFVALFSQIVNGADMDGLSGIDVDMCRAIKDL